MHFAAGSSVEDNRMQFLTEYCNIPPGLVHGAEEWAGMRDGSGWTPLHFLCQAVNRGHLLAEAGARRSGLDLLGHPEHLVGWLLAWGCELDAAIVQQVPDTAAVGFTALHLLAKPHHKWTREQLDDVLALTEALLHHGACPDPEVPVTGRTPLSLAATAGQDGLAALLVKYGADPASTERDGRTAIERCRSGAQMPMVKVLEEARRRWISQDPAVVNQRARRG